MDYKNFLKSWQGSISENKFHRVMLSVQSVCLVVALIGWQSKDRVTVIVPPTLNEKAEVAKNSATKGYKKSWGLYVAQIMGNISPANVDFVVESLSSLMDGEMYSKFRTMAAIEVDNIKRNGMSVSFEPRSVTYEKETDKIFVSGNSTIQAAGSQSPQSFTRVFEVIINIRNGVPSISLLDTYQGQAKTRDVLARLDKSHESVQKTLDDKAAAERSAVRAEAKAAASKVEDE